MPLCVERRASLALLSGPIRKPDRELPPSQKQPTHPPPLPPTRREEMRRTTCISHLQSNLCLATDHLVSYSGKTVTKNGEENKHSDSRSRRSIYLLRRPALSYTRSRASDFFDSSGRRTIAGGSFTKRLFCLIARPDPRGWWNSMERNGSRAALFLRPSISLL